MGIKGLFKIPNLPCNSIKITELNGSTIAVDAMVQIHASISCFGANCKLTDANGNPTSHIQIILNKLLMFRKNNIKQIWVFDGHNTMKARVNRKRRQSKEKYSPDIPVITGQVLNDVKFMLESLQIPYYQLSDNIEAEAYCAYLYKTDIVRYVMSNDSDTLVYGAELLRQQKGKQVFDHYNPTEIKQTLELTDAEFINMCVALGSDDFDVPKVKGIGPKTAVDKIKKGKFSFTPEQENIKKYYTADLSGMNFPMKVGEDNRTGLADFLIGKNFKPDRVKKMLSLN